MKFAIATILVAAVVARGKGGSSSKRKDAFWPNRDHTHEIETVWWNCNFEGDQDAYCTIDEMGAWWESECYDSVDFQVKHDIFCTRADCQDDDYGSRSWAPADGEYDDFTWAGEWDDTITDATTWGYSMCDLMLDTLEAEIADDENVNLQEMFNWYDGDYAPEYWTTESLDWEPVDFGFDNLLTWGDNIIADYEASLVAE